MLRQLLGGGCGASCLQASFISFFFRLVFGIRTVSDDEGRQDSESCLSRPACTRDVVAEGA